MLWKIIPSRNVCIGDVFFCFIGLSGFCCLGWQNTINFASVCVDLPKVTMSCKAAIAVTSIWTLPIECLITYLIFKLDFPPINDASRSKSTTDLVSNPSRESSQERKTRCRFHKALFSTKVIHVSIQKTFLPTGHSIIKPQSKTLHALSRCGKFFYPF
jgi:hypothetical protein